MQSLRPEHIWLEANDILRVQICRRGVTPRVTGHASCFSPEGFKPLYKVL
jgi:hypothetical protein